MKRMIQWAGLALAALVLTGCTTRRVYLVTEYAPGSPEATRIEQAIRDELAREQKPIYFYAEHMNTLGQPNDIMREHVADATVTRVRGFKGMPDAIIIAGDDAAKYFAQPILDYRTRFIYMDLKGSPAAYGLEGRQNVTGIPAQVPVAQAFARMKALAPQAKTVGVLADKSLEADAILAQIAATPNLPMAVVTRQAGTLDEWMAALRELQDQADVLCVASYSSVLAKPDDLNALTPEDVLTSTAQFNTKLPDFAFCQDAVSPAGVMLGVYVPQDVQARIATAAAVNSVLVGMPINMVPMGAPGVAEKFSPEKAQKFGYAAEAPK